MRQSQSSPRSSEIRRKGNILSLLLIALGDQEPGGEGEHLGRLLGGRERPTKKEWHGALCVSVAALKQSSPYEKTE